MNRKITVICIALTLPLAMSACGKHEAAEPAHGETAAHEDQAIHEHHAPHGGSLVEIGEEFAHLELLLDAGQGKLTAFSLDGEAEKPVRLAAKTLNFVLKLPDGTEFQLPLQAQASSLTGERIGDSSQFEATSEKLKGVAAFSGKVQLVETKGMRFENLPFNYPSVHTGMAK